MLAALSGPVPILATHIAGEGHMTVNGGRTTGPPPAGDGAPLAQPRIERRRFSGAEGIRSMPVEGRFESRDPAAFEAEVVRIQLGALVLRRTTMTPHRAMVDGREHPEDPDILRFMTVQQGSLLAAPPGGRPVRLGVGDALFTCRPRAYVYQADAPIVIVASTLPVTSLPAVVRRLDDLPIGPLPHSPLVDAVVDLLVHLSQRLDEPWSFDADYAARGLIELETAILTEVIGPQPPAPGPDRVHSAALDYIERHLGEPDLRPPQIADALGVSLRYLHRAFDDKEVTVARYLRERRLEQVAQALRSAERQPSLHHLAERYGFSSQDQLARAFRRRYGTSMTEYRAAGRA
jgi:AraC-like DNA-binding protein